MDCFSREREREKRKEKEKERKEDKKESSKKRKRQYKRTKKTREKKKGEEKIRKREREEKQQPLPTMAKRYVRASCGICKFRHKRLAKHAQSSPNVRRFGIWNFRAKEIS